MSATFFDMKQSSSRSKKVNKNEPLGHGDHWAALGLEGETLISLLTLTAQEATAMHDFQIPWPQIDFGRLVQLELPNREVIYSVILGKPRNEESLNLLSGFPILCHTSPWILEIFGVEDSYGPFEGVITANADTGHGLEWFAPRFGREAEEWRRGGRMKVGLSGLALSLERFTADPIVIKDGPRIAERREELNAEGRHDEANDPNLTVTFRTEEMRTLYSSFHDHHELVGQVLRVAKVRLAPGLQGWRLEVQCRHDENKTGSKIPLYVFPPALSDGYVPKRGDLIQGTIWLQGTHLGFEQPA